MGRVARDYVTNMTGMFWVAILFNGDMSKWDVSGVTNTHIHTHTVRVGSRWFALVVLSWFALVVLSWFALVVLSWFALVVSLRFALV